MSYETVIDQVKTLPEEFLDEALKWVRKTTQKKEQI